MAVAYFAISHDEPIPDDVEVIGETAGGVLVKRQHGPRVDYCQVTKPAWRYRAWVENGKTYRELTWHL